VKRHNKQLRYELAKSAIAGTANMVMSAGITGEPDYRINNDHVRDLAFKALALADAVLDELEKEPQS